MGACGDVRQQQGGVVSHLPGPAQRDSLPRQAGRQAIHLVSAWASANTVALGQVKTEEKYHEITAIPRLLEMLELNGCIVTIDAMGCQKESTQGIVDRGADYMLAVKRNQGRLYEDLRDLFEGAREPHSGPYRSAPESLCAIRGAISQNISMAQSQFKVAAIHRSPSSHLAA